MQRRVLTDNCIAIMLNAADRDSRDARLSCGSGGDDGLFTGASRVEVRSGRTLPDTVAAVAAKARLCIACRRIVSLLP